MNILYCGDKYISDGLVISVLSLAKNISDALNVYILTVSLKTDEKNYEPVSRELAKALDRRVKEKNAASSVTLIDISELFAADKPLANMGTRFTPCCMLRLFADKVAELPDKILYLDNDVVCRRDCTELYGTDVENYEVAGALDYYGKWFFRKNALRLDYLNSGVLLLNLSKIRETGLFEKCRRRCRDKKMFMPDQSAINKLARYKKVIPRCCNEQRKLRHDTVLQHFTTSFRFFPWFHSVSVKPWQADRMHKVLGIYEYDGLLGEYNRFKERICNDEHGNSDVFLN